MPWQTSRVIKVVLERLRWKTRERVSKSHGRWKLKRTSHRALRTTHGFPALQLLPAFLPSPASASLQDDALAARALPSRSPRMPGRHGTVPVPSAAIPYHRSMNDLVINVRWEYFLGILGSIVALAYYASGRFTRLETDVQWLSDAVRDLTIRAENISTKLFAATSPVSLTFAGQRHLEESGLRSYINRRKDTLIAQLRTIPSFDRYRVQDAAFRLFANIRFDDGYERRFHKFAFESGISTDLLRRLGAIYLRDIAADRT
jgi:hypothetical protein